MDFASFQSIASNSAINSSSRRIALDGDTLIDTQKASVGDKLGRAFRIPSSVKGSFSMNVAVRTSLAMSLGKELGLDTSDYGTLLKNLQHTLGKDVFNAALFKESGLKSGRPLTARRVSCIVNAAIKLNPSIDKLGSDNGLLSQIGADEADDPEEQMVSNETNLDCLVGELEDIMSEESKVSPGKVEIEMQEMDKSSGRQPAGEKADLNKATPRDIRKQAILDKLEVLRGELEGASSADVRRSIAIESSKLASQAVIDKLATKARPDLMKGSRYADETLTKIVMADDKKKVRQMQKRGYDIEDSLLQVGATVKRTKKGLFRKTKLEISTEPVKVNVMSRVGKAWTDEDSIMTVGAHRCTKQGALEMVDILREAIKEARVDAEGHNGVRGEARQGRISSLDDLAARVERTRAGLVGVKAGKVSQQTKEDLAVMIDFFNLLPKA